MTRPARRHRAGFTLIELAVVVAIIGFLLGAILLPLSKQNEARQVRDTESRLAEIREALLGYAMTTGRLPCPDTDGDGRENPAVSVVYCREADWLDPIAPWDRAADDSGVVEGWLPWRTLGVAGADPWGRLYVYAVTAEFTNRAVAGSVGDVRADCDDSPQFPTLLLGDVGCISVYTRAGDKTQVWLTDAGTANSGAAAVVISLGANGSGGRTLEGTTIAAPAGADEIENVPIDTDGAATFVTRVRTEGNDPACDDAAGQPGALCEFDDVLIWIPTAVLMGRLVTATQLP